MKRIVGFCPGVIALFWCAISSAASGDVAGSADHPLLGRFEGSVITYYRAQDFDAYTALTGPVKGRHAKDKESVEGKVIRIAYSAPAGTSFLQINRNFELKMQEAGFETLFKCQSKACGGLDFTRAAEQLPLPYIDVNAWNFHYLAARLVAPERKMYATVQTSKGGSGKINIQVVVAEQQAMTYKMVDANAMAKGLASDGHIALYNIYFDTDKATLKSDSTPALQEIAKLMVQQPGLKLLVVGHTDNVGALEYNEDLSRRRADSVIQALATSHGVDAQRLSPAGVGMYAPVASNHSEEGRAKNRRVELVER